MTELVNKANSPIYCGTWISDNRFIIGGGGGSSKSGISNFLTIYKVNKATQTLDLVNELKLSSEEDCPMSCSYNFEDNLLIAGINSSAKDIADNNNKSLKIFSLNNNEELKFTEDKKILISNGKDEYQKVTRFSKSGTLVFIGSAEGQVSILSNENYLPKLNSKRCKDEMIDDGDFNEEETLFASSSDKVIHIWKIDDGEMVESLEPPVYKKTTKCQYRAIRFGREEQKDSLYAFINSKKKDHSYIAKFKVDGFDLLRTQSTGLKPITAVAMSNNGKFIAIALSDLSVKLIDSNTLKILQTFKNLHTFPITTLQFNPSDSLLLSASTDSSFRVLRIPNEFPSGIQNLLLIVITILILILAILYQLWPFIQTKF